MEQEQSRSMRMFQIMDRLRRAWSEFHPSTDLNKSQLGTLLILRHGTEKPCAPAQQTQHKPMTMSELAARMGQSMPAVSQRISKLEAMGYVRCQSDPRDRRTTWIHLTDAGIEQLEQTYRNMVRRMEWIMERMGQENTEMMFQGMERLAQVMELMNSENRSSAAAKEGDSHPADPNGETKQTGEV